MVRFRVPFVTLKTCRSVNLLHWLWNQHEIHFESRFAFCYFFGAKKNGIQVKG